MLIEKTLVILKPDADERGLVIQIRDEFEKHGLIPLKWHCAMLNDDFVKKFYLQHSRKNFFKKELQPYMTRSRICYGIFSGPNIVQRIKRFVGEKTNPQECNSKTLRAKFGKSKSENTIHRSDCCESAEKEIQLLEEYLEMA